MYRFTRNLAINREPVLCPLCGLEIPGTDAEIKALELMRHRRKEHQEIDRDWTASE